MHFTIGDLAKEFEVTLRALRFYEDKNLIKPHRRGVTRIYSLRDRARLKLILMGRRFGFSLIEIKEMLNIYDLPNGEMLQLKLCYKRFSEQMNKLNNQKEDIENSIDELSLMMSNIENLLGDREKLNQETA